MKQKSCKWWYVVPIALAHSSEQTRMRCYLSSFSNYTAECPTDLDNYSINLT